MAGWPIFARVCMWFTYAQIVACIATHIFVEIGPRFENPDPAEIAVFNSVRLILLPVFFLEIICLMYEMCKRKPQANVVIMCRVVIWEMCVKMTYYGVLAKYNGGIAHLNLRAFGPPRPIYLTRWLGWSFAIPTLLTMANHPLMDDVPFPTFFYRIFPMLAATWAYCWSCYLGCVVHDMWLGWFLIILGCVGYIFIIVDQAWFFVERFPHTPNPDIKAFITVVREAIFVIYTLIWLLGIWGYVDSYWCQVFYSYGDCTLKCTFTFLLKILRALPSITDGIKEA